MLWYVSMCCAVLCSVVPCGAALCSCAPSRTAPHHAVPCRAVPCRGGAGCGVAWRGVTRRGGAGRGGAWHGLAWRGDAQYHTMSCHIAVSRVMLMLRCVMLYAPQQELHTARTLLRRRRSASDAVLNARKFCRRTFAREAISKWKRARASHDETASASQ